MRITNIYNKYWKRMFWSLYRMIGYLLFLWLRKFWWFRKICSKTFLDTQILPKKVFWCSELFSQRQKQHFILILGTLIACHGYFYAIDEHVITLKDDNSFNRFQSENYWPSKGWEPDQSAYAIYLIKRSFSTKVSQMIKINMFKVLR